jgi:uncharacterized YigZ family protein
MKTNEIDSYFTIDAALRAPELKERSSRFIADLMPVSSKDEIDAHLGAIRKEFYDATHHCYAYRLGPAGEPMRAADDGEPAGTAGKPILQILTAAGLTNILCIVTRYFGGTKLGTGGLVRAYSDAAAAAVALAARKEVVLTDSFTMECSYEMQPSVERFFAMFEVAGRSSEFGERVNYRVAIRKSLVPQFVHDVEATFYGTVKLASVGE